MREDFFDDSIRNELLVLVPADDGHELIDKVGYIDIVQLMSREKNMVMDFTMHILKCTFYYDKTEKGEEPKAIGYSIDCRIIDEGMPFRAEVLEYYEHPDMSGVKLSFDTSQRCTNVQCFCDTSATYMY